MLLELPEARTDLVRRHCHGHDRVHHRLHDLRQTNRLNLHPNGSRVTVVEEYTARRV